MVLDNVKIFAKNERTGDVFELGNLIEIGTGDPYDSPYDDYLTESFPHLTGTFEITASIETMQPKVKLRLFGISNNSIRMHGGKPIRTIQKRFLRKRVITGGLCR